MNNALLPELSCGFLCLRFSLRRAVHKLPRIAAVRIDQKRQQQPLMHPHIKVPAPVNPRRSLLHELFYLPHQRFHGFTGLAAHCIQQFLIRILIKPLSYGVYFNLFMFLILLALTSLNQPTACPQINRILEPMVRINHDLNDL